MNILIKLFKITGNYLEYITSDIYSYILVIYCKIDVLRNI